MTQSVAHHNWSGAQKIYKLTEKLKFLRISSLAKKTGIGTRGSKVLGLCSLLLVPITGAGEAHALPVMIGWQVPLSSAQTFQLEVASDPGFGTSVLQTSVTGHSFSWDAPSEGVYHWRLMRVGKTGGAEEGSTFVSGSFIAVDPSLERQRPAKISWEAVSGADRYKIFLVEKDGKSRTLLAGSNSFILPKTDAPVMVEVVPYSGGIKANRDYHYNASLKWDSGIDQPLQPAAPVAATPVVTEPQPAAVAEAPPAQQTEETPSESPPAEAAVEEKPAEPAETAEASPAEEEAMPARRRVYQLSLFGFVGQEKLRLQKLEVFLSSLDQVAGLGGNLWINPAGGLVVTALGSYHEHKGEFGQKSIFGDNKLSFKEARYLVQFGIGWNLLHWFDVNNQFLTLSFVAAAAQLPFLPLEYDASAGTLPKLEKKQLSMPGGSLGYSWLGEKFGLTIDGGVLKESTDDVTMGYQQMIFDYFSNERVAISVGFYNRYIQSTRCHQSSAICLKEGKVTTSAEERGVYLGAGAAFF